MPTAQSPWAQGSTEGLPGQVGAQPPTRSLFTPYSQQPPNSIQDPNPGSKSLTLYSQLLEHLLGFGTAQ